MLHTLLHCGLYMHGTMCGCSGIYVEFGKVVRPFESVAGSVKSHHESLLACTTMRVMEGTDEK